MIKARPGKQISRHERKVGDKQLTSSWSAPPVFREVLMAYRHATP